MRGIAGSWLISGEPSAPPTAAGALVLDDDERVHARGTLDELRGRYPEVVFERLNAVLLPGLINAHTHLELSALRGLIPGGRGFVPWVDALMNARAQRPPEQDHEAIELAVSELLEAGVMAVGEVCNRLDTLPLLAAVPIVPCIFHEVFGRSEEAARAALERAAAERRTLDHVPGHARYALAPHTPFTLHPTVLKEIIRLAADSGRRTSLHLAEHAAERTFLETGGGPFAAWAASRHTPPDAFPAPGCGSVPYVDQLGGLGPQTLCVHLTDARPDELAIVAARGCPVVLCPRSNLHIELRLPPLLDILSAGLRPGLGTDSLASNASLDPLAEARALQKRFPTVAPMQLLAMATAWGADALGLGAVLGRLDVGTYPGVIAFEHGASAPADPARFVLEHERAPRRVLSRPAFARLSALRHGRTERTERTEPTETTS